MYIKNIYIVIQKDNKLLIYFCLTKYATVDKPNSQLMIEIKWTKLLIISLL